MNETDSTRNLSRDRREVSTDFKTGEGRCTARSTRTGEPCKRPSMLGGNVCYHHGGNAPQVKAKAQRRLQQAADALVQRLLGMALDGDAPDHVALAAIRDALDRAGLGAKQAVEVSVEPAPWEQLLGDVAHLTKRQHEALKRGELLPPPPELPPAEVVEAEFVDDAPEAHPEPHEERADAPGARPNVPPPFADMRTRVSTEEQADRRNGLEAQRAAIDAEAERRGWSVEHHTDAGVSGKIIGPSLREVLELLASGQGDGLVVAKLDRLSRSIINAANIIETAQAQGWSLVVLDLGIDLSTATGRAFAHTLMVFAQLERELIIERTKAGLAAKRARGERLGRPRLATPGLVRRIVLDRNTGLSFDKIAAALEAEGILAPSGGKTWHTSTVRRIYASATAATELASA